ncbi:hypothetical protein P691DRAFT_807442 [Macrolepiota fuliginosa MF-IS2]|uniref:Uncharacterized protein n=1 Tax=Macrolepiota fuliginosa MF-IS2 TaxID=1400762 RepID=A0A9P5XIN7_9AGAR|nr:hypothetical protein P691DRAFT_807442 [Macrolepiota fuliginosa MF-IS2]
MASIIRDIKDKLSTTKPESNQPTGDSAAPSQQGSEGQSFNILPHPAKSNDPADLQNPSEETGGLRSSQNPFGAFTNSPGPVQPNQETLKDLPPAKTREELEAIQAQLNK